MRVFVDADGCPVVAQVIGLCNQMRVPCVLICDTAHELHRQGAQTIVMDKGADSVDFALVNRVQTGDIVVTQDYGLASMCLARNARVLHQDGWEYTRENIDALLFQRHTYKKYRMAGGRIKGLSKRTSAQDQAFEKSFAALLSKSDHG